MKTVLPDKAQQAQPPVTYSDDDVERVAAAIADTRTYYDWYKPLTPTSVGEHIRTIARAAIAALTAGETK